MKKWKRMAVEGNYIQSYSLAALAANVRYQAVYEGRQDEIFSG